MDLLVQGVELMLLGMGTVFLFLTLLVLVMSAILRLLERILERVPAADSKVIPRAEQPEVGPELIAILTAAVRRYRSQHR
jgi:oxaloacetate decarboxylase gamma subunit